MISLDLPMWYFPSPDQPVSLLTRHFMILRKAGTIRTVRPLRPSQIRGQERGGKKGKVTDIVGPTVVGMIHTSLDLPMWQFPSPDQLVYCLRDTFRILRKAGTIRIDGQATPATPNKGIRGRKESNGTGELLT